MSRTRTRLAALAATTAVLLLAACGATRSTTWADDGRVHVLASFYPLQFVAHGVGGDRVDVRSLTPPGAEPHDLELSPAQVGQLNAADLVVYLATFQPAVDEAVAAAPPSHVIDATTVTTLLPALADGAAEAGSTTDATDPHFWLDPSRLPALADAVAAQLSEIDPAGATTYAANAAALTARLTDLDTAYSTGLATCASRTFVTSHAAFGYLADRYQLVQVGISGLDPEADPSPARLAEISRIVADKHVTTIFFETLVSPKVAETLAGDLGVHAVVLDPLEGVSDSSHDYISVATTNLAALREALACT